MNIVRSPRESEAQTTWPLIESSDPMIPGTRTSGFALPDIVIYRAPICAGQVACRSRAARASMKGYDIRDWPGGSTKFATIANF